MNSRYTESTASLNEKQLAAVRSEARYCQVLAGPGTGKTKMLTTKIAHLLNERKVSGYDIAAFTFTRRAAQEMKERLGTMADVKEINKLRIGTFHAAALRIVKDWGWKIGMQKKLLSVIDEDDSRDLVKQIAERLAHGDAAKKLAKQAFDLIMLPRLGGIRINWMLHLPLDGMLEKIKERNPDYEGEDFAAVQNLMLEYYSTLISNNAVDYNGLIEMSNHLLGFPEIGEAERFGTRYIFIDEFQDTDDEQWTFISLLMSPDCSLCVVADEDQLLYGWRAANIEHVLKFKERFPDAEIIELNQNYRSPQTILDASYRLIQNNLCRFPKEKLQAGFDDEEAVQIVPCSDENRQIEYIKVLLKSNETMSKAVLCRTNYQLEKIADALEEAFIPFQMITPYDAWRTKIVKRTLDVFRVGLNKFDNLAFRNLLYYPGCIYEDPLDAQRLIMAAANDGLCLYDEVIQNPSTQLLRDLIRLIDLVRDSKCDGSTVRTIIEEIFNYLDQHWVLATEEKEHFDEWFDEIPAWAFQLDAEQFISWTFTRKIEDMVKDEDKSLTKLMTVHTAKGLEFDLVILANFIEGSFPMTKETSDPEEERRIVYVGLTRAKKEVLCLYPQVTTKYKSTKPTTRSKFLSEISLTM